MAHVDDGTVPGRPKSGTAESKTVQFSTNYTAFGFVSGIVVLGGGFALKILICF